MMKDVKYFHGKDFKAKWLADDIIRKYHIKTMDDSEEVYIYNKGVYIPSETIIKQEVQKALNGFEEVKKLNKTVAAAEKARKARGRLPR